MSLGKWWFTVTSRMTATQRKERCAQQGCSCVMGPESFDSRRLTPWLLMEIEVWIKQLNGMIESHLPTRDRRLTYLRASTVVRSAKAGKSSPLPQPPLYIRLTGTPTGPLAGILNRSARLIYRYTSRIDTKSYCQLEATAIGSASSKGNAGVRAEPGAALTAHVISRLHLNNAVNINEFPNSLIPFTLSLPLRDRSTRLRSLMASCSR